MAGGLQSFALSTGDVFADARCSSGGDVGTDAGPTIVSRPTSTRIAVSNEPSQAQVYLSSTEIGTGVPTQARRRIIIRRNHPAAGDVDRGLGAVGRLSREHDQVPNSTNNMESDISAN